MPLIPVDPVSAQKLASTVVHILWTIGAPIRGVIKKRWMKRQVRRAVERVTRDFVGRHPEAAEALSGSAEAIAHELARLTDAGAPLATKTLADELAARGLDQTHATQYSTEYVEALQDELNKIDGFRPLLQAGAIIATGVDMKKAAELLQEAGEARWNGERREVAIAYFQAANGYLLAANTRWDGDTTTADGVADAASNLVALAVLRRDPQVLETFKAARIAFKGLVEERYDEFIAAIQTGDRSAAETALEGLSEGVREFQELLAG